MARLSSYPQDSSLSGEDRLVGSSYEGEGQNGPIYKTRTYKLSELGNFVSGYVGDVDLTNSDVFNNLTNTVNNLSNTVTLNSQTITNNTNAIASATQSLTVLTSDVEATATFQTNLAASFGTYDENGNILTFAEATANQILQASTSADYAEAIFVTNLVSNFGTFDENGNLITISESYANQLLGTANTAEFAQASYVTNLGASFGTLNPDGSVAFDNTSTYANSIINYVDSSSALATQVENLQTTITNIPQTIRQDEPPDVNAYPLGSIWIDTNDGNAIYILIDGTPRTWEPTTSEALGDLILSNAQLQTEIDLLSTNVSAQALKTTTLTAQFGVYDPATNTFTIDNNANVISALRTYADSESAAASKAETVRAQVNDGENSLVAQISETSTTVADLNGNVQAAYGIEVDANGNVASMKLLADGTSGTEIRFRSDTFKIYNGSTSTAAFALDGSELKLNVPLNGVSGTFSGTLDVQGVSISDDDIRIKAEPGFFETTTIRFDDSSGNVIAGLNAGTSPDRYLNITANERIALSTGGNGISIYGGAVANPIIVDGKIYSYSEAYFTGDIASGGELRAASGITAIGGNIVASNGTFTGQDFILSSDAALKENIKEYTVKPINIQYKQYNLIGDDSLRVGVIAQEIEKDHPEFVKMTDNGTKAVSYIDMLVAKVAELEQRIKQLENGAA